MSGVSDLCSPALSRLLLASAWLTLASACAQGGTAASTSASASPAAPASDKAASSNAAAPASAAASASAASPGAEVPPDWVDVDLSPGGAAWKGYSIKAPADAKLKKSAGEVTLESKTFAIRLSLTHTKKKTANLDTAVAYGVKWRALTENESLFEYETSGEQNGEKFVRFNFDMFVDVGAGKRVGCSGVNNQKTREELGPMMTACKTLKKQAPQ